MSGSASASANEPTRGATTPKTILVVDDEPDTLQLLARRIEASGYAVVTASDGMEALNKARGVRPALMILDLMLPKMDGYKVCRALKFDERFKSMPIFILSARSGEQDRRLALDMGADAFVTKPYDMAELVSRIRHKLETLGRSRAA